jgi:N6-adenosine-specific RNA methylase IME4
MSESTDIIIRQLNTAEHALSLANHPSEAAGIADKAEAARVYAKRIGASVPVINRATSIKLKAERKAGELLAGMEMAKPPGKKIGNAVLPNSLADIGITKAQSSRWQRAATVPEEAFEKYLADADVLGKEITTSGVLKLANVHAPKNGARKPERTEGVYTDLRELIDAGQKFGTVYADPPWRYNNQGTRAATDNHYDGDMSVEEICDMPIGELAAEKSHLHLWTTNAFLFECPKIFEAWGFEYKSTFVWVKPSFGIGNYWRNSHEIMLTAIRGGQTALSRSEKSWIECKRGGHSSKPEIVRHMIERLSPGPYLELFGRSPRSGWTVFGNQIVEELVKL